jgi:hypothetical protein
LFEINWIKLIKKKETHLFNNKIVFSVKETAEK